MGQWDDIMDGVEDLRKRMKSVVDENDLKTTVDTAQKAVILTSTFYLSNISLQRVAGVLSIHSGRPRIASAFGFASVALSSYIALQTTETFSSSKKATSTSQYSHYRSQDKSDDNFQKSLFDDRISLSVIAFSLIESKSFLTAAPSSVITVGAHANHGNFLGMFKGSVLSTDPTATPGERSKIQKLGRRYGCHHCGSKQRFHVHNSFIADHMPPTKNANEANAKWWRKFFNFRIVQRLYPQCQSCFSLQGNAVRINNHHLIYHYKIGYRHFAPTIIYFLHLDENFRQFLKFCSPENIAKIINSYIK